MASTKNRLMSNCNLTIVTKGVLSIFVCAICKPERERGPVEAQWWVGQLWRSDYRDCEIAAYSRVGRSVSTVFTLQRIITVFLQKRKRGVRLKREGERKIFWKEKESVLVEKGRDSGGKELKGESNWYLCLPWKDKTCPVLWEQHCFLALRILFFHSHSFSHYSRLGPKIVS